ncbi:MAG: hypothetical protein F6K40_32330 [Okeania sp. SIO3I5]|uniref:hypothetical protein n=1 Tax=Okeania sp. SIO3I5 TaxID=2607805 RepID=UPI0013B7E339|nr:hypothetical protein [Okeania sp. SIO3I5]NEQ40661.1 hypothetical protein [Okeania sp. SIO3I5]
MSENYSTSDFQEVIEIVEKFSLEDREILLDILKKRLSQERRRQLEKEIAEVRQDYQKGKVMFGTVDGFLAALDKD